MSPNAFQARVKIARPTYAYVCCPCTASAKALVMCVIDAVKDP